MRFERSNALQERLHAVVPGGAHTYAKGDDQYPEGRAPVIARGLGCHVWDVDGNEFIEYGMGLRSVTLGHAYEPVLEAVRRQLLLGANFTRPAAIELQSAEALVDLIEGADMAKFAKNGSDATTAAVKLARAWTGRDLVAIPAHAAFLSVDDWFIGSTEMAAGVPHAIQNLTVEFEFNDISSLERLFEGHEDQIACVIMEAAGAVEPVEGFLEAVRALCTRHGTVLVFDEMITGFRWHLGGAQKVYGVEPDLATFGKAMGNGFSIAALVGRRDILERGGLRHDAERVFLLSTTHGAETHALAAALEVMRIYREEGVIERLYAIGARLAAGVDEVVGARGLRDYVGLHGRPCNLVYATLDADGNRSQPFRTLFLQELLRRGVLAPSLVVSTAHTEADLTRTVDAIDSALQVYRHALDVGIEKVLEGRPVKPVLRTRN
jgi:glutamate-1-semialdehyde 2,1-aminomutase